MRLNIILVASLVCCYQLSKAQSEFRFALLTNYAPNNYTTGNGFFTSEGKIESLSQSPVLHFAFSYVNFKYKSFSLGIGLEYSYVRAKSNDYALEGINGNQDISVNSNDIAVRNYLLPTVSAAFDLKINNKRKLIFALSAKLGVPFFSYDRVELPQLDPFTGNTTFAPEKTAKYSGDDFGGSFEDGLMYGGEFSCLYSFFAAKNKSKSKIQIGPNTNIFKLNSVDGLKYSVGLKFVYALELQKD